MTNTITREDIKFRCSSLYNILTHEGKDEIQKGHISECRKLVRQLKHDRQPDYITKYTEKGIQSEEAGITVLNRYLMKTTGEAVVLKKNEERVTNDWITGLPDTFIGEHIRKIKKGYDLKCSWDLHTFPDPFDVMDKQHDWQMKGYSFLTGAEQWFTAYVLVNAPAYMITREKEKVWYAMGQPSEQNDRFIEKIINIEKNMIFDMPQFRKDNPNTDLEVLTRGLWNHDMALEERVLLFETTFTEADKQRIIARVEMCRDYIMKNLVK